MTCQKPVAFTVSQERPACRLVSGPSKSARSTQWQWTSQSAGKVAKQRQHSHQQHAGQGCGQYHMKSHFPSHVVATYSAAPMYPKPGRCQLGWNFPAVNDFTAPSSFLSCSWSLKQVTQALKCVTPASRSSKARIRHLIRLRSGGLIERGRPPKYSQLHTLSVFRQTRLGYLLCLRSLRLARTLNTFASF